MALPVMSTPTYELIVPSTKQVVKFRPFLVKEEKSLLIAQQSENETTMLDTLTEVIKSCTMNKLDVSKLAVFDIEYIFIQLRARSVGEVSELIFSCLQCNDPKGKMPVNIDLTKLEVELSPEHTNVINLFDDVGIKMKYPGLKTLNTIKNLDANDVTAVFSVVVDCIDSIFDSDNVYAASEQTREELESFINNLTNEQFQKIQKFFDTMPKLEKKIEFDCPVCKHHHTHMLQGLDSFF